MADTTATETPKNPLKEITQPFVDLFHAPRALWGVNLAYVLEGTAYFGVLSYLAIYFSDYVFRGIPNPDPLRVCINRVLFAPSGRYRAFERRAWKSVTFDTDDTSNHS